MRAVLQKVRAAKVTVEGATTGVISSGWLVYIGVGHDDERDDADWLKRRILALRFFTGPGEEEVTIREGSGEILVVSQFTLFANCRKGGKPSWHRAASPEKGEALYRYFIDILTEESDLRVQTGQFGGMMEVESVNDGPITLLLDSRAKSGK